MQPTLGLFGGASSALVLRRPRTEGIVLGRQLSQQVSKVIRYK